MGVSPAAISMALKRHGHLENIGNPIPWGRAKHCEVFGVKKFYWLVQEKTYPYLPAVVECSEETLFTGEMKFHDAVERITRFLEGGQSPDQDYVEFRV